MSRLSFSALAATATLVAMVPLGATPSAAADVAIAAQGPVVELRVTQQVLSDPDKATVNAGVTTRGATAVEAMRTNATQMERMLAQVTSLGVPEDRVQTSGITLNPQYNYNNNQPPQFTGYEATNTVTLELRELDRIGPVLDALVAAGATNLNGPMWAIVDDTSAKQSAREAAFAQAREQAEGYAKMAGFGSARLLAVEETLDYATPMYDRIAPQAVSAAPAASTPTRPGRVATQITLTVKYALEQ
ncbi:SIMPL domain-containing protein [Aurantiacibacter suaedae]|uniref:SIMPL domain-containing protein n=1 Tax=Aurantiacibacter suaedae TaxID=2545755 RepID=UPI0010F924E8|nr:SIMPL domain-containing protein [Aurantiacibacter suaedae]